MDLRELPLRGIGLHFQQRSMESRRLQDRFGASAAEVSAEAECPAGVNCPAESQMSQLKATGINWDHPIGSMEDK